MQGIRRRAPRVSVARVGGLGIINFAEEPGRRGSGWK